MLRSLCSTRSICLVHRPTRRSLRSAARPAAGLTVALLLAGGFARPAHADLQLIAPETGRQDAAVVSAGSNGICETPATSGDVQAIAMGRGAPNRGAIRCGSDRIAQTTAWGDDRQLMAVGEACSSSNTVVVDTGANGIADTAAVGDDSQVIQVGRGASGTDCIVTGSNGIADTEDPLGGDDSRGLAVGAFFPHSSAVACGPNGVADSHANNINPNGDDVQLIAPGASCSTNTPVVDTGANGISDTRAEGPDFVISVGKPLKLAVSSGRATVSKSIKVDVLNREFGELAPLTRDYMLLVDDGTCPGGTVGSIDASSSLSGLQQIGTVTRGSKTSASFVVTVHLDDIVSVESQTPWRCILEVSAQAVDTAPALDDAVNQANNTTFVDLELFDGNDL